MKKPAMMTALLLIAVALGGCTTAAPTAPPTTSLGDHNTEAVEQLVACLHDAGWEVDYDESSASFEVNIPEEQYDAYSAARDECNESVAGLYDTTPLTEEQLSEIYEYEKWTAECLRAEGIDVLEIPSEETFIERYTTGDPWLAYGYVGQVNEDRWNELLSICPQL